MSTPDPTEIETLIAQRYIESALAGLPQMWEDKFAALDAQAATPAPDPAEQWTVVPAPGTNPQLWYVVPPKSTPTAYHPIARGWQYLMTPEGVRVIPSIGRQWAQSITDQANQER